MVSVQPYKKTTLVAISETKKITEQNQFSFLNTSGSIVSLVVSKIIDRAKQLFSSFHQIIQKVTGPLLPEQKIKFHQP